MEKRRMGELTTLECRADANEEVDKALRRRQVKSILREGGEMSAKEVAVEMFKRGYVGSDDRNFASPRLNEMCKNGDVEQLGKKICQYSGRPVTVFAIREE